MIKNIVFDMGNVIIRFDPRAFIARFGVNEEERELLLEHGITETEILLMLDHL